MKTRDVFNPQSGSIYSNVLCVPCFQKMTPLSLDGSKIQESKDYTVYMYSRKTVQCRQNHPHTKSGPLACPGPHAVTPARRHALRLGKPSVLGITRITNMVDHANKRDDQGGGASLMQQRHLSLLMK